MNQYSELLYFLKGLAEDNPFVNTVTKGSVDKIDLEKANIYPLFHIDINDAGFTNGSTITFEVTLTCLNQRDINKEIVEDDKFWSNDNEVDNHNETLAILNDVWLMILRDWQDRDITTEEDATLQKIEFSKGNILDGWSLNFTVELPNTTISLCGNLVFGNTYGYLYSFPVIEDNRELTSSDKWYVPTSLDYSNLAEYLGGFNFAGGEMKEIGVTHWESPNVGATNSAGFSLLGSGFRANDTGLFSSDKVVGVLWTSTSITGSTTATARECNYLAVLLGFGDHEKNRGSSIRLVMNAPGLQDGVTATYIGNDGITYKARVINGKYWITENLKEKLYRDGSEIPTVTDNTEWSNLTTGAKCAYNNDESNV